jgi:DNA-binding response OmpR family regulator
MTTRVLVAEDDDDLGTMLGEFLGDEGFDVQRVADGEEAMLRIGDQCPALLITDIHMPRVDGLALIRWLRNAGRDIPVVLLSGAVHPIDEPGIHHLAKPFDLDDLLDVITAALGDVGTARGVDAP